MPRKPRVDCPGAFHHVMNRGARRGPIFERGEHCLLFLDVLDDVTRRLGWEVHAFALMPNHFHLLVRSVHGNLSRCMQRLGSEYTRRLNAAEGWDGPSFRGRFANQRITEPEYLRHVVAYIHLNPVRAHLVRRPDEECWTSHRAHLGLDSAPGWLATWMVEQEFGSPAQLQAFVRALHSGSEPWPDDLDRETGWLHQPTASRRRFRKPHAHSDAPPKLLEPDEVLARVRAMTGASPDDLRRLERGPAANPARRFAAWMLSRHTELSRSAIAERLNMRPRQLEALLYRLRKRDPPEPLATWQSTWERPDPS